MRIVDIFSMALVNLWQRKIRTCLNMLGIVIGCMVLLLTAAGASGVKQAVQAIFDSSDFAKEIRVSADHHSAIDDPPAGTIVVEGDMQDERRERIRKALVNRWKEDRADPNHWQISLDEIKQLEKIPHVQKVVPDSRMECRLAGKAFDQVKETNLTGADASSLTLSKKMIAGSMLSEQSRDEVLVNEILAYDLGFKSDADLERLIGTEVSVSYQVGAARLGMIFENLNYFAGQKESSLADQAAFSMTFTQLLADLDKTSLSDAQKELIRRMVPDGQNGGVKHVNVPKNANTDVLATRSFRICGIVNSDTDSSSIADLFLRWFHNSYGNLYVHHEVATEMKSQVPELRDDYYSVTVKVSSSKHLESVTEAIEGLGMRADSALNVLENIQYRIDHARWFIYLVSAAILFASALGISNTLVISVLQRTPEFGILKAIGARDRDLVLLMLIEGALLGIIGATLTMIFGWTLSYVGHSIMVQRMSYEFGSEFQGQLFQFELLPVAVMYAIAIIICVGASVLPAWRAARLDPVIAMRRT